MGFHIGMKRTIRALLAIRKNMATFLPFYLTEDIETRYHYQWIFLSWLPFKPPPLIP
jgi:hypothetical protein